MNNDTRFFVMYNDGLDIINKAERLCAEGWEAENIYLLLWDRGDLAIHRYRTRPDVKLADGTWMDYFEGFISGEAHVKKAMSLQGIPLTDPEMHYDRIQGGGLLLYADHGQMDYYYKENSEFKNAAPDTVIKVDAAGVSTVIDSTPNAIDLDNEDFPYKGDHRVAMDGQNIRRIGDQVADPAAEVGFDPDYYKIGQDAPRD